MSTRGKSFWVAAALAAALAVSAGAQVTRRTHALAAPLRVTPEKIAAGKAFGIASAPIRIDEYSDFECPHCQLLYLGTLRPLIDDYVSSGKVYLVHHDFPLPSHTYAHQAADLADAAAALGRFPQVEQALFLHQGEWAGTGRLDPIIAGALSPSETKEVEALAYNPVVKAAVEADLKRGQSLGIDETPTMYVTYKGKRTPIIGTVSYPILRRYLDALLQQ